MHLKDLKVWQLFMFDCLTWLQTCEAVKTESGADSSWTRYYCLRWKRSRSLCLRGFSLPNPRIQNARAKPVVCLNHSFALTMVRSVSPRETREKLGKPQKQQATLRWQNLGRNFFGRAQIQHVGCPSLLLALAEALRLETMKTVDLKLHIQDQSDQWAALIILSAASLHQLHDMLTYRAKTSGSKWQQTQLKRL